jgi:hypothetical protein
MKHTESLSDLSCTQLSLFTSEFQGNAEICRSRLALPPALIFVTLSGGAFMPAFALALGANNFYLGALAAIPFFANLFQLASGHFVENLPTSNDSKRISPRNDAT